MAGIELKSISAGYNNIKILTDISLKIGTGDFIGIIGPNGTGKTTLLKIISGLLLPLNGEVIINDKNIKEYRKKELAKLQGVVTQQFFFSLPFTCLDVVLMGRFPYINWFEGEQDYEIARQAMELTDTYALKDRAIQEISGGELQRVRIARAIAQEPKFLLLDEPTAHLDIHHEIRILEILKKLNSKGLTVVVVSHNLNTISAYTQKIAILSKGKIIKVGSPAEVVEKSLIEEVYGTQVLIKENPLTHTPYVIPIG